MYLLTVIGLTPLWQ